MPAPQNVLIIGSTRGLGASLLAQYAGEAHVARAFGTTRGDSAPSSPVSGARYITNVDVESPKCAEQLLKGLSEAASSSSSSSSSSEGSSSPIVLHRVIVGAGLFASDSFAEPDWEGGVRMYTISCVAPVALVSALAGAGHLAAGGKVVLVGSEAGSVALRTDGEGGGNYGHHGSKAAANMVGKLLSLDLKDKGVAVATLHPGFMRTEMTKGVGYDKFWDEGGAVTPDVAAESLRKFVEEELDMSKTGEFWAPRGPADIGTAEEAMGKDLPTPLRLPN